MQMNNKENVSKLKGNEKIICLEKKDICSFRTKNSLILQKEEELSCKAADVESYLYKPI